MVIELEEIREVERKEEVKKCLQSILRKRNRTGKPKYRLGLISRREENLKQGGPREEETPIWASGVHDDRELVGGEDGDEHVDVTQAHPPIK